MTIRIVGFLHAFYYNQERQQVLIMLQDRSKYTLDVPRHLSDEIRDTIGLTQPGDEVEITASAPDICDSAVKTWENVSLTRWLSKCDGEGNVTVSG